MDARKMKRSRAVHDGTWQSGLQAEIKITAVRGWCHKRRVHRSLLMLKKCPSRFAHLWFERAGGGRGRMSPASATLRNSGHMVASRADPGALHSLWQREIGAQPVARRLSLLEGSHRLPFGCLWGPSCSCLAKGLTLQQSRGIISDFAATAFKMQWCCVAAHRTTQQVVSWGHAAHQNASCCRASRAHQRPSQCHQECLPSPCRCWLRCRSA